MDDRAKFANRVCTLIYQKNNGDLTKCLSDIAPIYADFFEHVPMFFLRNIGEIIEKQIPMFFLYELKKHGRKKWNWTEEEFNKALEKTTAQCHKLYEGK